ncbi:MAG: 4Fe-4S binding protein [Bacillota bacterium]|nr:4Fe-4S binding protein [Bacillota bacterium]
MGPFLTPVLINTGWCKKCGICVEFCPCQVLAMETGNVPYVIAPDKCTRCRLCELLCPDFAVTLTSKSA